ncbi:MAG: hypothetical protein WCJ57_02495 [Candidatus Falkowbacteria bacterium]
MFKFNHSAYRILVFIVGILATVLYRLTIIVNNYSFFWFEVCWYLGTLGFIWYFGHRFRVESRRDNLIEELNLVEKVKSGQPLNAEDKEAVVSVLSGLSTSLAKWNYIAIFVFSFLAIAYALFMDINKYL